MKLSKKMLAQIELEAKRFKSLMEEPNPEVEALIAEIKESVQTMPKNMTKEEEIAYILNN